MLKRSEWGKGYATEAGLAIRDEAFERLKLDHIIAMHHLDNVASGRIMEKLGMTCERLISADDGWKYRLYRLTRAAWALTRA